MYTVSGPEEDAESGQTMRGVVGGTKLFNRFTLEKVLGRGGMGVVWLARDERLDRLVALKLVPESVCFDASAQEDLKRETRKSLLLTHPGIVRIFDFIEDEHSAAISMEYVDGSTLSSLRVKKPSKCFEVEEIAPWIASLCDALSYAHESAGIVHRDLKPANLMVNSRGELKITDFGIACTLRDSMSYVSVRTSSGTLNYMSPQQLLGEDPSAADDIYAVGATLYEMLSSKPPFHGGDVASQVREVIPPTIAQRRAKFGISGAAIPKYWEETIAACLSKEAAQRPRSPAEIARRLRLGGAVRVNAKITPKRKFPVEPQIAVAAGVVALVTLLSLLFHRPKAEPAVASAALKPMAPAGYAMEKPTVAASALVQPPSTLASSPASLPETAIATPAATEPSPKTQAKNATLRLTTTPSGATVAIYPGVIAGKSAPGAQPFHSGPTPESIEDLPPGRYTLFFHNDGWPDDRSEISVGEGETVPVDYTFPHGKASVASTPDGAEIFYGNHSLGRAPLDVDLPPGKQKLIARLSDFPDRTQTITIESGKEAKVAFQMRTARTRSSSRATPTPSALDKIGQSFKNVFGRKDSPQRKKR